VAWDARTVYALKQVIFERVSRILQEVALLQSTSTIMARRPRQRHLAAARWQPARLALRRSSTPMQGSTFRPASRVIRQRCFGPSASVFMTARGVCGTRLDRSRCILVQRHECHNPARVPAPSDSSAEGHDCAKSSRPCRPASGTACVISPNRGSAQPVDLVAPERAAGRGSLTSWRTIAIAHHRCQVRPRRAER
jgi:hypothetical protein